MNKMIYTQILLFTSATFLLSGCSFQNKTEDSPLVVENNQVDKPEENIQQAATTTSEEIIDIPEDKVYANEYFSIFYNEETTSITEWDMDDSATLKLSFIDSDDYLNIHYASDYSYSDYCMAISDKLADMSTYYGSKAQIGKDQLSARSFEYNSSDDFKVTFYLLPAKSGVVIVEVGSNTTSHGENSASVKEAISEMLNSIEINEAYTPSEYDFTSTKIVEETLEPSIE